MTDFETNLLAGLVLAGVSTAATAFWWIVNKISTSTGALHKRIDAHEERLSAHVVSSNEKFLRKDDFEKFDDKLTKQLDKISDKIDKLGERRPTPQ